MKTPCSTIKQSPAAYLCRHTEVGEKAAASSADVAAHNEAYAAVSYY